MHVLLFFGAPLDAPHGDSWYFDAEERLAPLGDVDLVFYGEAPSVRAALAASLSVRTIQPGSAVPVGCGSIQENAWKLKIMQAQQALGLAQIPSSWHVASVEDEGDEDWLPEDTP